MVAPAAAPTQRPTTRAPATATFRPAHHDGLVAAVVVAVGSAAGWAALAHIGAGGGARRRRGGCGGWGSRLDGGRHPVSTVGHGRERLGVVVGSSGHGDLRVVGAVSLRSLGGRPVATLCRGQHLAGTAGTGFTGTAQQTHGRPPVPRHRLGAMTTTRSQSAPALQRPDGSAVRVLVVDDEPNLTELLSMALRYEGWDVRTAASGIAAVRAAKDFGPDAVVLDMMLPDFDGLEVLRRMRGDDPNVPVLFLTAKDAVEDRVAGLTAGGDDYVTKPFSLEEVVARLRALMRRTTVAADEASSLLVVGDLTMDEDSHEVIRAGDEIHLTATEFELLRYLMRNPKRVLSKAQILDRVWNYDFGGQANVVELYISYLRKKIDVGRSPMIHTMRGVGYVLKPAD